MLRIPNVFSNTFLLGLLVRYTEFKKKRNNRIFPLII